MQPTSSVRRLLYRSQLQSSGLGRNSEPSTCLALPPGPALPALSVLLGVHHYCHHPGLSQHRPPQTTAVTPDPPAPLPLSPLQALLIPGSSLSLVSRTMLFLCSKFRVAATFPRVEATLPEMCPLFAPPLCVTPHFTACPLPPCSHQPRALSP